MEKYSYSKLCCFKDCPYKFKLVYIDKHFIDSSSIATNFGTLIHYTEECIANDIKDGKEIDYEKYIQQFININDEKRKLYGVKKLKELYPNDFYKEDKTGTKYSEKCAYYVNEAIYRLENYLKANPYLEVIGIEKEFNLTYGDYCFHGFIDRIFRDKRDDSIIIEDIKTYSKPLEKGDLVTPLQFVFYTLAVEDLYGKDESKIRCAYDLPLCDCKQEAGTKGFLKRGTTKIDKLLEEVKNGDFHPNPTPLCHFCPFCPTYNNQPEEAKGLCPYYSKWTPEKKIFEVEYMWMGMSEHDAIMKSFKNGLALNNDKPNNLDTTEYYLLADESTKTEPLNRFFKIRI